MQIASITAAPFMPRPTRCDFHVVPLGTSWAIKCEGSEAYRGYFATQVEATGSAMHLARQSASSVVVHGRDGRFRTVYSYS